jgi:oligopeptide transport system permease protein
MFKNSLNGLLNQTQVIMLYILTSLPIIEKLSSYRGAGYELLESILNNEDSRAIAYLIPFLVIMLLTIYLSETIKRGILPHYFGGEQI